ncbi:hypothetical protein TNCV_1673941 [Trichonephila clavipes]|nr:hypothetical protein TNCV_1673941 [Trichonephila clavipes]
MFDPSSFANPTPLAHANASRDVLPRGGTSQFPCRKCGGGDRGGVAIYRPFGEFRRAKSYCHLYGAQGQRQAYL